MQRRDFFKLAVSGIGLAALGLLLGRGRAVAATKTAPALPAAAVAPLSKTNEEWKKQLSPAQYHILREEGTERPFTSDLLNEKRKGSFACVACDLPLFTSDTKYDSGTGWPSFFAAIPGHLGQSTDYKLLYPREEYHCARCGGHHGHVFNDGPKPTGLRYCNNGVALKFIPATEA